MGTIRVTTTLFKYRNAVLSDNEDSISKCSIATCIEPNWQPYKIVHICTRTVTSYN